TSAIFSCAASLPVGRRLCWRPPWRYWARCACRSVTSRSGSSAPSTRSRSWAEADPLIRACCMCCSSTGWPFPALHISFAGRVIAWKGCSATSTKPMPWNRCWTRAGVCDERKRILVCSLRHHLDHPHRLSRNDCVALFAAEAGDRGIEKVRSQVLGLRSQVLGLRSWIQAGVSSSKFFLRHETCDLRPFSLQPFAPLPASHYAAHAVYPA